MKLAKYRHPNGSIGVGVIDDFELLPLNLSGGQYGCLADILEADQPREAIDFLVDPAARLSLGKVTLLPPIDHQEVWAAGMTYRRAPAASPDKSPRSVSCYEQIYQSDRPNLFFKATPHRVVGPEQAVRIRRDSVWAVPEPELALVLNSRLQWLGCTVGNDVCSRDIERENPLYLPQARVYDASCGLGPCITLRDAMPDSHDIVIEMQIMRSGRLAFADRVSLDQMTRSFNELVAWLSRENSFPNGAFLLTGTGIVLPDDFSLQEKDVIEITISGIGTLVNPVAAD